jgi:predicted nucleotidyltransferase
MESPVLDTVIERIVEVADPERILLFGSAARGRWVRTAILIFW